MSKIDDIKLKVKKELKLDVMTGDDERYMTERISTGMPMLDFILGGGIIRRKVLILHGNESSGKSYIAYKTIASAQKNDMICGLIDVEYSYDPIWGEKIGIDNENLLIYQPDTAENALDVAISLCENEVDVLVVDSLAALLPEAEHDASMQDWQMGLQARLINKFLRKLPSNSKNTAIILINQHRVDIGGRSFHGYTPYTLPGGQGQSFFSSIMVETKRGEFVYPKGQSRTKKGSVPNGFHIRAKTTKNKTHIPRMDCDIPVYYTGKTDFYAELFDLGNTFGIIKRGGAYYSFGEERVMGKEGFIELLKGNEELALAVQDEISDFISKVNEVELDESVGENSLL